jgi:hypothetical protein
MSRKLSIVLSLLALALAIAPSGAAALEIEHVEGWLRDSTGSPFLQAGGHPDFNTSIHLTKLVDTETGNSSPDGNPKNIEVTLPAGLIGNPSAVPTCTQGELSVLKFVADCSPSTQVGIASITNYVSGGTETLVPVYNMVPPPGVAAEFAFNLLSDIVHIDSSVVADASSPGGYRLETQIKNISQGVAIGDTTLTLWGNPASSSHDRERTEQGGSGFPGMRQEIIVIGYDEEGKPDEYETIEVPILVKSTARPRALMTNPTTCSGSALTTGVRVNSWQAPDFVSSASYDHDSEGNPFVFTGCDRVPFEASFEAQPTTAQADSPTGLDVTLNLPQNELPEGISSAALRDAVVTLPEGMAVDPSSAGGLGSCTSDQIGLGSDSQPACPANSKIGSVQIDTPLLPNPLTGSVYLAQQGQNKFSSLLALYLVVDDPATGVLLKIPGKVETDPTSGRVVARFTEAPQLPVESLQLHLDGGPRAALVTPPGCGTYTTQGEFSPWSGNGAVASTDSFKITGGPEGQPCPSGRFDPTLQAGTANPAAGQYSPFEVRIARGDGNGRLGSVSVQLPKGLLAKLAGVPYCSDSALGGIPTGEGTGGAQLASPSCPAASKVGTVAVSAGAGQSPFWVKTGSAYLAGPYKGAPLSLAVVTPALAGPFDLGNVVVRVALHVDPETAQVTADSDALPTMLSGIPLDLRELRVTLDREGFTLNPTSCAKTAVTSTIVSTGGATATPQAPFAASGCEGLGFAPKLALSLKGGTSRGSYPQLTAKLNAQPGQANLARVAVQLPHTEFLAQGHIGTVCTRVQFAADQCPERSIYGYAEATTPLLAEPLRGPVYLRSSSHKLPDLVAALKGQIEIDLDGRIDSHNRGIRTTFATIPDAPISSFTLRLKGGKKSLLENSASLCGKTAGKAQVSMLGQNGAKHDAAPKLAVACGKKSK